MRILVADDSRTDRLLLEGILTGMGHETTIVENGAAALDALRKSKFPIALLDWMMPDADGPEVCRTIRREEQATGDYTYFLIVTAKENRQNFLEALEAGADDFITKPVDPEVLASRVRVAERLVNANKALAEKNERLEFLQNQLIVHNVGLRGQVESLKRNLAGMAGPKPRDNAPPGLAGGEAYLVECREGENNKAYSLFKTETSNGFPGFILSRTPEQKIRVKYGVEGIEIINLSKGLGDGAGHNLPLNFLALESPRTDNAPNRNLQAIAELVNEFMGGHKDAVVLLDGIEYLFTRFQTVPTMEMLYELGEIIRASGGKMLVACYPDTLDPRILPLLKREMNWIPSE